MSKVLIIGGGAAGMMAAVAAARCGHETELFEKNEKLGKKLFITGKGRCNLTNACDRDTFFQSICTNEKFMYSSFSAFSNLDTIDFFEELGLKTKIERGNRVFPASDHSSDVIQALAKEMHQCGVKIHLNTEVKNIMIKEGRVTGICLKDKKRLSADSVFTATGGCSYPLTGSTGDGYFFAEEAGHLVTELSPALVPVEVGEAEIKELQGLSLRNVRASIRNQDRELYSGFGEMLFTHYGVSGPLILTASSYISKEIKKSPLILEIDLKPALSEEQLDKRILRDFEENQNKQFKNMLGGLLPAKLIPVIIKRSGIRPEQKIHDIDRQERRRLVLAIKKFSMTLVRLRGYEEAIITKGGVSVNEIHPATMESKKVKGLYFIGEVLDLDAVTGGFNLQLAWSTAYAAGNAVEWVSNR